MIGAILGTAYAAFFGANNVIVRRGMQKVSSNYMATLTVFSGPIFFFFLVLATGELFKIPGFNWKATLFFAASGVVHFAIGRTSGYRATQILGATRSGALSGLNAIVSVILAVAILKETLSPLAILGILFSLSGPGIIAWSEERAMRTRKVRANPQMALDRKTFYKGVFFGLGAALFWGSSALFIKLGLDNGGSSVAGSFIAYCAASVVVSFSLLNKKTRDEIFTFNKPALKLAGLSGMTTNLAQMMRYLALNYGSVITVSLVSRTMPMWTLLFSFIFNRKIETFNRWVLIGNAMLVVGTILVIL